MGYGYTYDNSASGRDGSGVGALTELEIFGGGLRHGATISYGYDSMYRLTEKTTTANENAGFSQTVSYGYRQLGSGRTTGQVSSYRSEVNGTATAYTYTYDSNGNITRITDQSGKVTRYTYDKLGQLTREDNPYLNKTYVYTYDNAGNRLSKKKYAYTTGTPGNATATESYNYTGDRLTQVGSTVYQYDAIGNPTTYNGYTLEWNGRKLMEMSMNVGQFLYTFAYNADGIRTVKTNGSTIHHYTLNGSQIVTDDDVFTGVSNFLWIIASKKAATGYNFSLTDDALLERNYAAEWITEFAKKIEKAQYDLSCMEEADNLSFGKQIFLGLIKNPDVAWYANRENISYEDLKQTIQNCRQYITENQIAYYVFVATAIYREELRERYR